MKKIFFTLISVALSWTWVIHPVRAQEYLVHPCPFGIKSERPLGHHTPSEWLPTQLSHNQGDTITCSIHAATGLMSAQARKPLSVLDVLLQLGSDFSDEHDPLEVLSFFRNQARPEIAVNTNGLSIKDAHTMDCDLRYQKHKGLAFLDGNRLVTQYFPELVPSSRDLLAILDRIEDRDHPMKDLHHLARKSVAQIEPFNLAVRNQFGSAEEIRQSIVEHFERTPSPLMIGLCDNDETCDKNELHVTLATGIRELYCEGSAEPTLAIDLLNSYGGPDNGPFDLNTITKGMDQWIGDLTEILPCGEASPCLARIVNEEDPLHNPLISYAQMNDAENLARLLQQPHWRAKVDTRLKPNLFNAMNVAYSRRFFESLEALLLGGANPNQKKGKNRTLLYAAAETGDLRMVQTLLRAGASPNLALASGATPLMIASDKGHVKVVQALLAAGADHKAEFAPGQPALLYAILKNHTEVEKILRDHAARIDRLASLRKRRRIEPSPSLPPNDRTVGF